MRTLALISTCCIAALAPVLGAAAADDPTRPDFGSAYPSPNLQGQIELSIADAISMGLENNLNVAIERHQPLIAHEDAVIAWGAYDPLWNSEFGYSDDRFPTSNALAGVFESVDKRTGGFGGIQALVPWLNTSVSSVVETAKTESNAAFQSLSPRYDTRLNVVARQPLLKGLIWNETWTLVKTSRVLEATARENFRRDVMNTVQAIEDGYWALVADDERVRVAEKSLETAKALLEQVTTQYEVGVVSRVEIAQAEAGVADREFNLIVAQNAYQTSQDRLINLVLGPHLAADSRLQLEPTDRPDEFIAYDIDTGEAAEIAFRNRPELAIAKQEIDRREINLRFAKNQRLPQVDVEGRFGHAGLSGDENPGAFSPPDPSFLGDWGQSFERQANSYGVKGILTIPLGNVAGRHGVSKAQLELRRAYVEQRRVEQNIILEIRDAVRDIASAQEGIEAAQRGVAAAEEQLRAERIRLEYGESTPFDVLLREEDLVRAESQEIGAFQTYRTAVTALDRSQGTILRNRNIRIDEVARLR